MNKTTVPAARFGRRTSGAAVTGTLAAALLALAGCSTNTPTAIPPTSPVPTILTGVVASPTAARTPEPLPDRLAGLHTLDAAATARGGDRARSAVELDTRRKELTQKAYSDAYGSAAVAQTYASDDLAFLATVIAVAAHSPGLTIGPVSDPADLGLAVNMTTVVTDGQVQCVVNTGEAVPSGEQADPDKAITVECQRTGPALTVLVFGAGTGTAGHQQMVDLATAAWTAAGGS